MRGTDLKRVLTEAAIFAGRNDTLPMLKAVRLESTGTRLLATATDRFMLGSSSTEYVGRKWAMSLTLDDALVLSRVIGTRDHHLRDVTLERKHLDGKSARAVKGGVLRVSTDQESGGPTIELVGQDYEFPKWRALLTGLEGSATSVIGIDPTKLAKFGKIKRFHSHATWVMHGHNKPVVCYMPDFVGLVMPIRLTEGSPPPTMPEWIKE